MRLDEKETTIVFDEKDKVAHIQTYNGRLQRRLAKIHEEHPNECKEVKPYFDEDNGAHFLKTSVTSGNLKAKTAF